MNDTAADHSHANGPTTGHAQTATFSSDADGQAWTPPTWEEIVSTHSGRVYRLAYRLTGNQHDVEDLTQEVFVRVFRSLSTHTPGTFEGWLHRITTTLPGHGPAQAAHPASTRSATTTAERQPPRQGAQPAAGLPRRPLRRGRPAGAATPSRPSSAPPWSVRHRGRRARKDRRDPGVKPGTVRSRSTAAAPSCARRIPRAPASRAVPPAPASFAARVPALGVRGARAREWITAGLRGAPRRAAFGETDLLVDGAPA